MLVVLTNTILVRVDTQEEAGELAALMTNVTRAAFDRQGVPEFMACPLGCLVQAIPEDVAS